MQGEVVAMSLHACKENALAMVDIAPPERPSGNEAFPVRHLKKEGTAPTSASLATRTNIMTSTFG